MGKRIYVNGGVLVNTRFYNYRTGYGILYDEQPEGTVFLDPKDEVEGSKCLIIDDDHPQSIFNSYYAKTFFTSLYNGAAIYTNNYIDCFNETAEELGEVERILAAITAIDKDTCNSLMKFLYINIVTIIDSFICSIILATIVNDENRFIDYYKKMFSNNDKIKIEDYLLKENRGMWEKMVIEKILRTPFENVEKIKDSFGAIGLAKPNDPQGVMAKHFYNRNVLVHRNGKKMDGSRMIITEENVRQLLADTTSFIENIQKSIPQEV